MAFGVKKGVGRGRGMSGVEGEIVIQEDAESAAQEKD